MFFAYSHVLYQLCVFSRIMPVAILTASSVLYCCVDLLSYAHKSISRTQPVLSPLGRLTPVASRGGS